jgi:hypothetical protein
MDKVVEVTFRLEMTFTVVDTQVAEAMLRQFEKFAADRRASALSGYPTQMLIQTFRKSVD